MSTPLNQTYELLRVLERSYFFETFNAKRKIAIAGISFVGITLLVIGILALLHIGALESVSSAAAWTITSIAIACVITALGFLYYNIRTEQRIKHEMQRLLDNPTIADGYDKDAEKILANRKILQNHLLLLGDKHGLLNLGKRSGYIYINGGRGGDICIFVDENQRDTNIRQNIPYAKMLAWHDLRNLPS